MRPPLDALIARNLPALAADERGSFNPRLLCFMLPIAAGDRVLVLGGGLPLAHSVRNIGGVPLWMVTGAQAVRLGTSAVGAHRVAVDAPLPLPDGSVDHVIADLRPHAFRSVVAELARVVAAGGNLFVAAPSRLRVPRGAAPVRVQPVVRSLRRAGFDEIQAFGIWPNLTGPRHVVPLDSAEALRWYVTSAYTPMGPWAARMVAVARRAGHRRLLRLFFPSLGFAARRIRSGAR